MLTMECDKYICVREEAGGTKRIAVVDLSNNGKIDRRPITAESVIISSKNVIALRSGQNIQAFSMLEKKKLNAFKMPAGAKVGPASARPPARPPADIARARGRVVRLAPYPLATPSSHPAALASLVRALQIQYWRYINDKTVGIVTDSAVFHWDIYTEGSKPKKMFDRHDTLKAGHQVISYQVSGDGKWLLLVGIKKGAGGVEGQMQLYSVDKKISQPLKGHAGIFAEIKVKGSSSVSQARGSHGTRRDARLCVNALISSAKLEAYMSLDAAALAT